MMSVTPALAVVTGSISGTVTGPGGAPLEAVSAEACWVDPVTVQAACSTAETAADGTYTISDIPIGWTFGVDFWNQVGLPWGCWTTTGYANCADETPINVTGVLAGYDVQIPAGIQISGTVTDSGAIGLAGIPVEAWTEFGRSSVVGTGSDGTYSLGVWPGTYVIGFNDGWNPAYTAGYYSASGLVGDYADATPVVIVASPIGGINATLGDMPDLQPPYFSTATTVTLRSGVAIPSASKFSAVPVTVSWEAGDWDAWPGDVDHYTLERSLTGGAWTPVPLPTPLATSLNTTMPSTGNVAYRVTACDTHSNCDTSATGALTARITQQSSALVKYVGGWTAYSKSALSGGSDKYGKTKGATASFTFTGRGIGYVGMKGTGRGSVKVYIDGKYKTTVSLYKTGAAQYRLLLWQQSFATSAKHTVKLVVVGTAGRPRVDLDAFVVLK
jgi:hypothetical protein